MIYIGNHGGPFHHGGREQVRITSVERPTRQQMDILYHFVDANIQRSVCLFFINTVSLVHFQPPSPPVFSSHWLSIARFLPPPPIFHPYLVSTASFLVSPHLPFTFYRLVTRASVGRLYHIHKCSICSDFGNQRISLFSSTRGGVRKSFPFSLLTLLTPWYSFPLKIPYKLSRHYETYLYI
jgi:hypothetical protein